MGGTFNPIHIGHLIAAQCVYDSGEFEKILFMPSNRPPHKNENSVLEFEHRFKMCEQAIKGYEGFYVSNYELTSDSMTYSVDTFTRLVKDDPDTKYWLIIGTDSVLNLENWYNPSKLLKIGHFIVLNRGGFESDKVEEYMSYIYNTYNTQFKKITMPNIELSSDSLRKRISIGHSIKYRTPDGVIKYIEAHNLYKGDNNENR